MNEKTEEKLAQLGEQSFQSLMFPEPMDILEKIKDVKQRSKFYFKVRYVFFTSMILIIALLCGFTIKHYYFDNFKTQEDNGEINIYNVIYNKNGIKIKLEAVYSDGLKTYAKISASGLENIPSVDSGTGVVNKMKQVYLIDNSGNKWGWRDKDVIQLSGGTITSTSSIFDVSGLQQNEAVLYFNGAPVDGAKISFEFELNDGQIIKFSDLLIHVTKIVTRDVSNLNLIINLPYAQGKIQKITYAETKMELVVDWTVDDQSYIANDSDYFIKHVAFIDNGNKELQWFGFVPDHRSDGKVLTNNSIIHGIIKPDQALIIKLYNQVNQSNGLQRGSLDQLLCVIPAME